jgi:hypothetical protein
MSAPRLRHAIALIGCIPLAFAILVLLAGPASADNCDLQINPEDCQNTAWTVGVVAVTTATVTVAVTAATAGSTTTAPGTTGAGADQFAGPGGGAAPGAAGQGVGPGGAGAGPGIAGAAPAGAGAGTGAGPAAGPPGPVGPLTQDVFSGQKAIDILTQSGLVTQHVQPDGTSVYRPVMGTDPVSGLPVPRLGLLNGANVSVPLGQIVNPVTGDSSHVQTTTMRVDGIGFNVLPDGTIDPNIAIVATHGGPGPWQNLTQYQPGISINGPPEFVDTTIGSLNTLGTTDAGRHIMQGIASSRQQVTIVQGGADQFRSTTPADRFRNLDGTPGRGTGGTLTSTGAPVVVGDGSDWRSVSPPVLMGHELAHARDAATGTQARGTSPDPTAPPAPANPAAWRVRNNELQATSIGPFAGNPSDENAIRAQLNQQPRTSYLVTAPGP